MDKVRFGVIGLGNMGSSHVQNLFGGKVPGAVLTAVCDVKPARLDWARGICGDSVSYFENSHDLITSGQVDAVMIATPHYYHPIIGIDAFENGLNVLSEKPIGVYTKKIHEFMDAAKKSGKAFGIMYNQRTNPLYQKMREIVRSGELGELKRCVWIITDWYRTQAYYNSGGWRATWSGEGGGVLLNQCPHNLDLWQWICGMPVKVQTQMQFGKWHDIEVEDDVTTYVEYPDGGTGVFITSTGDAHGDNRFEIQMDKARFLVENDQLTALEYEMSEPEFSVSHPDPFSTVKAHELKIETDGKNEQHCGVLNAWAGNILRGIPLVADGRDGINGLMLSNAMHLSAWLGKEISLPFDEELFYNELMKRVATSRRKENVREIVADAEGSYGGTKK